MMTFDECLLRNVAEGKRLNQHIPEWRAFLEYAQAYFLNRAIFRPRVVEIGILDGAQRVFYEELLNAEYLGIDINKKSVADIKEDSRQPETVAAVEKWLNGNLIDLLFIDGLHTYLGVMSDYTLYSPLTRHIVALHDIHTGKASVTDTVAVDVFWRELVAENKTDTIITFQHYNPRTENVFNGRQLGIGVVQKAGADEDKRNNKVV